jgi:hypothetical protein
MDPKTQRFYAVWKYDLFPFFLCGPVKEIRSGGRVTVEGYDGMLFVPVKILPEDEGREMKKELKDLEMRHRAAVKKFNADWRALVDAVVAQD